MPPIKIPGVGEFSIEQILSAVAGIIATFGVIFSVAMGGACAAGLDSPVCNSSAELSSAFEPKPSSNDPVNLVGLGQELFGDGSYMLGGGGPEDGEINVLRYYPSGYDSDYNLRYLELFWGSGAFEYFATEKNLPRSYGGSDLFALVSPENAPVPWILIYVDDDLFTSSDPTGEQKRLAESLQGRFPGARVLSVLETDWLTLPR
ncbi:hypothetical protein J7S19_11470 [Corynebacterium pyruviciproducens]|uniref:hypothetical protein n=1 Tax=Corynebacterium pyruviciproducens TaxID=598660 RepID=UPI002455B40E|nr:hypothetical protein [Corynebacterium pyruviciproducens]MDH4659204.1 hypothetical protein [Corynebacterium pyruviciproducens]